MTILTPQALLNLKKYRKKGPKDKSRNPNPKTPTMMGEEKKTRFKERLTEMDIKKLQEMINKKKGGLSEGQKKIAAKAPPFNKINEKDFAVLRAEKAKDRGMGLQDEKVKPGKVMKAKRGKAIEKLAKKKGLPVPYSAMSKSSAGTTAKSAMGKTFAGYSKVFKTGVSAGDKAKATSTIIGVKPKLPEASKVSKAARRALKGVKATSLGKKLLPVVAAGVAAQQYLKSKMKKKKELKGDVKGSIGPYIKKKMGGGMMKKYNKGMTDKTFTDPKTAMIAHSLKTKDKITDRDREAATYLEKKGLPGVIKDGKINRSRKKMGGGMMKVPGYAIGSPKTPEERRRTRGPQQAKKPEAGPSGGRGALGGASSGKTLKQKLMSARIEGFLESTKDKVNPLKGDRVAGRGEKRVSFKPGEGATLSKRGTTGVNWRAGKDGIDEFVMSGDAKKNYQKTGKLFTNYSGKMMGGGMMNKPMGYKSGKSIKVKCKLGKNKPTKMY